MPASRPLTLNERYDQMMGHEEDHHEEFRFRNMVFEVVDEDDDGPDLENPELPVWEVVDDGLNDEVELNAIESHIPREYTIMTKAITVDSGAGHSVMDPSDAPGYELEPSPGSEQGLHYLGPGSERIPNLGQVAPVIMTRQGAIRRIKFQGAKVRKPLLAVSGLCDKGHFVMFDNDLSAIVPRDSEIGREIRRLLKLAPGRTELERRNGTYQLPAWLVPAKDAPKVIKKAFKDDGGDVIMRDAPTSGFPRRGF